MKKRSLTVVVLVILTLIIVVITVDFMNNRPDRRGDNPFKLEVEQYRKVDPALISHKESRNLSLGSLKATCMVYNNGRLYVAGDSSLVVILPDGTAEKRYNILPGPTSLLVTESRYYIGYKSFVTEYNLEGDMVKRWDDLGARAVITNLAGDGEQLYVADAGNRRVVIYTAAGKRVGVFEGKAEAESGHGFIIPSGNFDLAVNSYGELWVVNPGKHALENYSDDGRMRGFWENSSVDIEGFLGCCNPARITVMEDGSFITSEKGLIRIKIHDQSGKLKSVVAPPSLFEGEKAPDLCVDEQGVVYLLDFDRNVIRIFEPKENG
ncbi:MAG: hypothetical protein ABFS10_00835 [Bacteroidota bacterium]